MYTAAHYMLEGLVELGIEYIFANLGTDHVAIIEEVARWDEQGRAHPRLILCPHESVAMHMAGGYALSTGRGQVVLVHVDAGTANACMGVQNLFRARIPVFLMAGRAPYTIHGERTGSRDTYVHFVQDPFDIASIVRPYVKWEYSLPSGLVLKEALSRGHAFMQSDPPGPVYMTLPRETLSEEFDQELPAYPELKFGPVKQRGIEPVCAAQIAERLISAKNPIAITSYLGRNHDALPVLDALARECGIRVVESNAIDLNMPHNSPCFAGYDPGPLMPEADLGLLLDVDVPWVPQYTKGADRIPWIQIDTDPLKADFPMWGFPTEMRIQADCAIVLGQVLGAVKERSNAEYRAEIASRIERWNAPRGARIARVERAAADQGTNDAITPAYLFSVLNEKLIADDVVINEAIRNTLAVQEQVERTRPGTYVGLAGGGLGFSAGMALGLKLARPEARIVQIIGDGGFHFSAPDSVYAVAQQYHLPIFTIVLDNGGWQAVKAAVQRVYPNGAAAAADSFQSRLSTRAQGELRRFEEVGRAFGAYGESVRDPNDLDGAIDRCFDSLADGRAAVLTVRITPL